MANNRKLGNSFEAEFCQMLFNRGFWAHCMVQSNAGQPADVIAARGNYTLLVDCKVCSGKGFALSRIEPNQWMAMKLWYDRTSHWPMFALKLKDGSTWMLDYFSMLYSYHSGCSILSESKIRTCGMIFGKWVETV